MKCPACGGQLEEDVRFCNFCGEPLKESAESKEPVKLKPAETPAERMRGGLSPDEPEDALWKGSYSGKAMIGSWILAALISIALVIGVAVFASDKKPVWIVIACLIAALWLFLLGRLLYRKLNVAYELTSRRFIHKTGILSRASDRIELIDIGDVSFQQGLVERFVGVGTITVISSDASHPKLVLPGIADVKEVADVIDEARRRERRRRALHIENV